MGGRKGGWTVRLAKRSETVTVRTQPYRSVVMEMLAGSATATCAQVAHFPSQHRPSQPWPQPWSGGSPAAACRPRAGSTPCMPACMWAQCAGASVAAAVPGGAARVARSGAAVRATLTRISRNCFIRLRMLTSRIVLLHPAFQGNRVIRTVAALSPCIPVRPRPAGADRYGWHRRGHG